MSIVKRSVALWALLLGIPLAAGGEPARIAFLCSGPCSNLPHVYREWDRRFTAGLKGGGLSLGRDVTVDVLGVGQGLERLPDAARQVLQRNPRVIIAIGNEAVRAARQATKITPIVMIASDAVQEGFIETLARPGGNVTGLSTPLGPLVAKHLELLREINPRLSRVAVLRSPAIRSSSDILEPAERAARALRVRLVPIEIATFRDLDGAFAAATSAWKPDALLLYERLIGFPTGVTRVALQHRVPAIASNRAFVDMGALLSYGPDPGDQYERAALYVAKVLKGAEAGQLPVEEPTRFTLFINSLTAKALGITVPPSLLLRADEVID